MKNRDRKKDQRKRGLSNHPRYEIPRLTEFGDLRSLTRGGGNKGADAAAGAKTKTVGQA